MITNNQFFSISYGAFRNLYVLHQLQSLTFIVIKDQGSLVIRYVRADGVVVELLVAVLLLRAELLQDGALTFPGLEVSRVPCQLDPLVAPVLESLDEGCPLDHAAQLAPTGRLKEKRQVVRSAQ